MNMPDQAEAAAAISAADVILVVESDVPWLPATVTLRADVQVFHIDPDPAKASMPLWSYPVDFAVQADGPAALAAIAAGLAAIADGEPTVARRLADRVARLRERPAGPERRADSGPLTPLGVMSALNQVIDADDIVVEEAVTNAAAVYDIRSIHSTSKVTWPDSTSAAQRGSVIAGSGRAQAARPPTASGRSITGHSVSPSRTGRSSFTQPQPAGHGSLG